MRLIEIKELKGTLEVLSGLRVGISKELMSIGDLDNPVIRNPLTKQPYIPGSSLKGKFRSLIEWSLGGKYINQSLPQHVYADPSPLDPVARVFGIDAKNDSDQRGPTRLLVRDAALTKDSAARLLERTSERGNLYTEIKQEVMIPRIGGNAKPRTMERVPAGAEFSFEAIYRVIDTGDKGTSDLTNFQTVVVKALRLLELDALGGSTSRGYGQIKFRDLSVNGQPLTLPDRP
jgi:CRISPR-associated protein Csm3